MKQTDEVGMLKPYVPTDRLIPQFSPRAAILGVILALVFGAANAYMGLKLGMTVTASIPAAVMGMAIFKAVMKKGNVLEVNMVQTIASSGESLAAGIVFTMPALIFLGLDLTWWKVFAMSMAGGLLGIIIMIPLRHNLMVEEHANLPFPEGSACAQVILAGEEGGNRASFVFLGIVLGGAFRFLADSGLRLWREVVQWSSDRMHQATIGFELSPILLGVGFLIGPRISAIMFSGGLLGWVVLIPLLHHLGSQGDFILYPGTIPLAEMDADGIWDNYIRYIGAGGVAFGGILSLLKVMPTVLSSFRKVLATLSGGGRSTAELPRVERDLDMRVVIGVTIACVLGMLLLPVFGFGVWGTLVCLVFSFFFVAVSARMVGLIGSTAQPVSGMTIAALLATAALFYQLGMRGEAGQSATIMVAAVVCIAICMSGDIAQDLKTGVLLGATPWKQQLGEVIGTLSFALIGGSVVLLLHQAYTLGSAELPTPQGRLMADLVRGVMGGQLPWTLIFVGAGIALCVELMGISALPFAIGLYLPITTSAPVIFGGLLAWIIARRRMGEAAHERGTLFGSGLIAGDALTAVILAVFAVIPMGADPETGDTRRLSDLIALREPGPGIGEDILALLPFLGLMLVFWLVIGRSRKTA